MDRNQRLVDVRRTAAAFSVLAGLCAASPFAMAQEKRQVHGSVAVKLKVFPAAATTKTLVPANGILSPGFTTVRAALAMNSSYIAWKPCTCSRGSLFGPWSMKY